MDLTRSGFEANTDCNSVKNWSDCKSLLIDDVVCTGTDGAGWLVTLCAENNDDYCKN